MHYIIILPSSFSFYQFQFNLTRFSLFQIPAKLSELEHAKPTSGSGDQEGSIERNTDRKIQEQFNFDGKIYNLNILPEIPLRAVPEVREHFLPLHRAASADPRHLSHWPLDHDRALWSDPHHHCHQGDL